MSQPRHPWPSKVGMLVLFFCAAHTFDLFDTWRSSPADAYAWVALMIWLSPLAMLRWIDKDHDLVGCEARVLYGIALCFSLAGQIGHVNTLEHIGLLLAMTGLLRWSWRSACWLAAGLSWMPAFGWLVIQSWPEQILTLRVALAMVGAGLALVPFARSDQRLVSKLQIKRWFLGAGIAGAIGISVLWRFIPLDGAEDRLARMPTKGPGFTSWHSPLKAEERKLLGHGMAARRIYQFGKKRYIVSVVDGTLNRHAVHDPMYCFAGAGYEVITDLPMKVEGGVARCLYISQGGKRSRIVYWFSNGETRHSSILAYWLNTTIRRITFGLSGPEPVLVIVQCDEERESLGILRKFKPLFDV